MSQTSGLNTMIVGPEAAGKTVLAAVLAEFVERNPKYGLRFRASNFETKSYCDRVNQHLRRQDWPPSTRSGKLSALSWQWVAHENVHTVNLVDPPGQDVRSELIGQSKVLGIDQKIRDAHLLILTIDVVSHQAATPEQRSQNGWIVEAVLQRFDPRQMNLIIVLTKVDQLAHKIAERDLGNREAVLGVVRDLMPECSLDAYRQVLQSPNCAAVGVASVRATTVVIDGQQAAIPASPLASMGLSSLVGEIVKALGIAQQREIAARERDEAIRRQRENEVNRTTVDTEITRGRNNWLMLGASITAAALGSVFLIRGCTIGPPPQPVTITVDCDECGGDGQDGWWIFGESCKDCGGTGRITKVVR
jgi:hypothetical protein